MALFASLVKLLHSVKLQLFLVILVALKSRPQKEMNNNQKKRIPAIRGRVFPECVCIEDVDKNNQQRARLRSGKPCTAPESTLAAIKRLKTSAIHRKRHLKPQTESQQLHPCKAVSQTAHYRPSGLWRSEQCVKRRCLLRQQAAFK